MKHYYAVCDRDETYVRRFADYVNEDIGLPCPMQGFTNISALEQFLGRHAIELLIAGEEVWEECAHLTGIKHRVLLTEQTGEPQHAGIFSVYKYQSAETLIHKVMCQLQQDGDGGKESSIQIIGIYSPVKRSLKTSFGLALGQILSRDQSVLFMSMELFSGLFGLWKQQKTSDLSDILYYVRQGKAGLAYWADTCIHKLENLDCIFPPLSPLDLQGAEEKDWMALLDELSQDGRYSTVILDIDESSGVLLPLLKRCNRIYMPVLEDMMSRGKLRQYEQFLRQTGNESIIHRTIEIKPPYHKGFDQPSKYVEELVWGELGDYVRAIIRSPSGGRKNGVVKAADSGTAGSFQRSY